MKKINAGNVKVGTVIQDLNENKLVCVKIIDSFVYQFKWMRSDGSLSSGSDWFFPSHFYGYTLVKY